uniref:Uncharacterized protein n=1 Tax=Pectobacterium phage Taid TaxID=3158139 RepID=A0AB39AC88_9CAUD
MEKFGGEIVAGCQALIIGDHRYAGTVVNVEKFVITGEIITPPNNHMPIMSSMDLWVCISDGVEANLSIGMPGINIRGWCGVQEKNLMRLDSSREDERRFAMDDVRDLIINRIRKDLRYS